MTEYTVRAWLKGGQVKCASQMCTWCNLIDQCVEMVLVSPEVLTDLRTRLAELEQEVGILRHDLHLIERIGRDGDFEVWRCVRRGAVERRPARGGQGE